MFRGVNRLLPGHTLVWEDGTIQIRKYWDLHFSTSEADNRSEESYVDEWRELFTISVRLRLMSDVPLGMFLSGGIDSSAIAAVMSRLVDSPIKTFSVAFKEREGNELEYARIVANAFRTEHHEIVVTPDEFFSALPKLIWHEDEPIAHLASIPLYFVSTLAAKHVKVVLTGEGSDEMLAGYARYRKTVYNLALGARYQKLLPQALTRQIRNGLEQMSAASKVRQKLSRTFLALDADIENLYFDNFSVFTRRQQLGLFTDSALEQIGYFDPYSSVKQYLDETDASSVLNQLLYVDTKTYLQELLMKQDQMSMAASIESRVPFLDHKLVEFTARLPERLKLRGWTTKYILRQAMSGILPETILKRPKMGFPVPIAQWFRGTHRALIDEYVLSDRAAERDLFNQDALRRIVNEHQNGVRNHSDRLWALLNLEMWLRQFIDGEASRPAPSQVISQAQPFEPGVPIVGVEARV